MLTIIVGRLQSTLAVPIDGVQAIWIGNRDVVGCNADKFAWKRREERDRAGSKVQKGVEEKKRRKHSRLTILPVELMHHDESLSGHGLPHDPKVGELGQDRTGNRNGR